MQDLRIQGRQRKLYRRKRQARYKRPMSADRTRSPRPAYAPPFKDRLNAVTLSEFEAEPAASATYSPARYATFPTDLLVAAPQGCRCPRAVDRLRTARHHSVVCLEHHQRDWRCPGYCRRRSSGAARINKRGARHPAAATTGNSGTRGADARADRGTFIGRCRTWTNLGLNRW